LKDTTKKALGTNPLKESLFRRTRKPAEEAPVESAAGADAPGPAPPAEAAAPMKEAEGLLDFRPPTAGYADLPEAIQVVRFHIEGLLMGVYIGQIREVIRMVEITRMPRMPYFIRGIINFRGTIVPVVDLRSLLDLEMQPLGLHNQIIIAEVGGRNFGILIESISDVITVERRTLIAPTAAMPLHHYMMAIAARDDCLLPILDLDKVLVFEEKAVLSKKFLREQSEGDAVESFDEKTRRILHQRALELGKQKIEDLEPKRALLTFWMGTDPYGIFLEDAKEVLKAPALFRVPSAPEYCRGIINLRGDIIGVVDLRKLFNLSGADPTQRAHLMIIEKDEHMVGFLLDNVVGVAEIVASSIQPPLINIDKIKANFLEGECLMKDRIIAILNISNILNYL